MGFQQGISGLNAASKNLDVIGHNIANSGTVGFKSSRAEFSSLVANSMAGFGCSSAGGAGFGVQLAAVSQQFSQGGINRTGNGLDVAINGGGFFKLQLTDGSTAYTRSGNFKQDKNGGLVTNDGAKVMGYPITGSVISTTAAPLVFPNGALIPGTPTTTIAATLNLDSNATVGQPNGTFGTSLIGYGPGGNPVPVNIEFVKTAADTWSVTITDGGAPTTGTVTFDPSSGALLTGSPITLTGAVSGTLDLSGITQLRSQSSVANLTQDGYAAGKLRSINIGADGMVMASYSNGVTRAEAQMGLTTFANPQGLVPVGGNNWIASGDAGVPIDGKPGTGALGTLIECALEESNVDLTAELVNMMTAQRSYQANAQTIKTQDQVMSTLVNLR